MGPPSNESRRPPDSRPARRALGAALVVAGAGAAAAAADRVAGPAGAAVACAILAAAAATAALRASRPRPDPAPTAARPAPDGAPPPEPRPDAPADASPILEALPQPILVVGADGRVVRANPAAAGLLRPGDRPLAGREVAQVFTQAEVLDLYASARRGAPRREEVRFTGPEGTRSLEVAATPLALPDGPGVLLSLRDVTDQARAGHVRTDFVANASHELRTPIAALRAAVETLLGEPGHDPGVRQRVLGIISGHVLRLEELVRDLLDLSRLESPDLVVRSAPLPGTDLARRLESAFAEACRRRSLTLRIDFDPALEGLRTDPTLLRLILNNLVENAVKFAFEGTTVRVSGAPLPPGDGAPPAGEPGRRGARFEVADEGIGIPLAQQERIFERFYQVSEARDPAGPPRGTGLGLAIVKHAVRALGGQVRVRSMWKVGTTMTVDLPGCLDPAEHAKKQGPDRAG